MKKFSAFVVCFLMLAVSVLFVGCGNDEYTEVYSVTADGTTYTSNISITYDFDNQIEITEEEWASLSFQYVYSIHNFSIDGSYSIKVNDYIGRYYQSSFYKVKVTAIEENYIKVKIEENKISIKTKDGITEITSEDGKIIKEYDSDNNLSSVKTDFYTITYFN